MSAAAMEAGAGPSAMPARADAAAWLAVAAGTIGAFMAALDISIVNAALPVIQGEIGASGSEGTWISTAFLVSEIIVIVLSGWLERLLGLRRLLMIMTVLFIGFSMMCGLADSLTEMIIGRIGQGFTGGAMIPTAVTIVSKRLPPHQQPVGITLFGFTVLLGPVMGPLIGGWLTEHLSWRYAFFINLPVGGILLALLALGLPHAPSRFGLLRTADWMGLIGLILGLGGLTVVLEDGQRERWFESNLIIALTITTLIGFAMVAWGQRHAAHPVVAFRLLKDRGFSSVVVMNLTLGIAFFGSLYLIPQFLVLIAGYNAEQTGYVMLLSGAAFLVMMPFFPALVRVLDIRIALMLGFLCLGTSAILDSSLTATTAGWQFALTQLLRGLGLFFGVSYLNQAAMTTVDVSIVEDASSIFNCARNLGGSLGLALVATMTDRRFTLHADRLGESLTRNDPRLTEIIPGMAAGPDASVQGLQATAVLAHEIGRQAMVMTYADLFLVMGILMFLVLPLVLLVPPLRKFDGPMVA